MLITRITTRKHPPGIRVVEILDTGKVKERIKNLYERITGRVTIKGTIFDLEV